MFIYAAEMQQAQGGVGGGGVKNPLLTPVKKALSG